MHNIHLAHPGVFWQNDAMELFKKKKILKAIYSDIQDVHRELLGLLGKPKNAIFNTLRKLPAFDFYMKTERELMVTDSALRELMTMCEEWLRLVDVVDAKSPEDYQDSITALQTFLELYMRSYGLLKPLY